MNELQKLADEAQDGMWRLWSYTGATSQEMLVALKQLRGNLDEVIKDLEDVIELEKSDAAYITQQCRCIVDVWQPIENGYIATHNIDVIDNVVGKTVDKKTISIVLPDGIRLCRKQD